jgi:hypothetical protein
MVLDVACENMLGLRRPVAVSSQIGDELVLQSVMCSADRTCS